MEININADDLLKWAKMFDEMPRRNLPAIANALNQVGDGVADEIARVIADATDNDASAVRNDIVVYQADANNLQCSIDASAVLPPRSSPFGRRPWATSNDKSFGQLFNVVTAGDDVVCELCQQVAESGPYTMDEIDQMAAQWADYAPPNVVSGERTDLIHPLCRCTLQSFASYRKLPVQFTPGAAPPQLLTIRKLGRAVADALAGQIKIAIKATGV